MGVRELTRRSVVPPAAQVRDQTRRGELGSSAGVVASLVLDSALSNSGFRLQPKAWSGLRAAASRAIKSGNPRAFLVLLRRESGLRSALTGLASGLGAVGALAANAINPELAPNLIHHLIPGALQAGWMSSDLGSTVVTGYIGVEAGAKLKVAAQLGYDLVQYVRAPTPRDPENVSPRS